jgi:hypothetical protein
LVIHEASLACGFQGYSFLHEKSSLPAQAARYVLCLVVIIDVPSHRVVE